MTASVRSVEMAHPVADRRRGGDDIGSRLAHAFFGESVDRTRYGQRRNHAAGVVADRSGDGVQPLLQFLDRERVPVARGRLDLRLEFAFAR